MDYYRTMPESPVDGNVLVYGPDGFNASADTFEDAIVFACRLDGQHAELTALRAEVERLREERAFWRGRLHIASPKMDSQHVWRLVNAWPLLVGPDADAVVRNALEAIRSQPLPAPPDAG
jgi:hypothetical protein